MVGGRRRKKVDGLEVSTARREKKACSCSPAAPLSSPPAFFKVMIGNFRDVMFIPPRFACNLDDLVGQNVHLKDLDGNSSKVKISMVDGSLAFQQGWSDFVFAHSVKVGEILIFNYTSWSMFFVRVFGSSGCERIFFSEGNGGNTRRTKWKKFDSHLQDLNPSMKSKSNGDLKDICYIYDEDEEVKEVVKMERDPSGLPSNDIVDTDLVTITMEEDPNANQETEIILSFSESPSLMDDKFSVKQPEGKTTFSDCSNAQAIHKDPENKEENKPDAPLFLLDSATTITKDCLDDKEQNPPDERNHGRSQTALESECVKFGAQNPIKSGGIPEMDAACCLGEEQKLISQDRILSKLLLTEDGICHIHYEKLAEKITTKFLATEDGVCHILYEKFLDELQESRGTTTDLCLDKDVRECLDKSGAMPNENYEIDNLADKTRTEPTIECSKDEKGNCKEDRSIKEVPPHQVASVAGGQGVVPDTNQSGTLPDILPANEKLASFSNVENLGIVKTEPLEFDGYSSLKSINCSFSVPSTSQSWLELPKCLHKRYSKKKHERKIILLQDPLMRLWPVLYHESLMFTGFASGWNAFTASNNLQQGDLCELFEVFDKSNEVYQVQISKV